MSGSAFVLSLCDEYIAAKGDEQRQFDIFSLMANRCAQLERWTIEHPVPGHPVPGDSDPYWVTPWPEPESGANGAGA